MAGDESDSGRLLGLSIQECPPGNLCCGYHTLSPQLTSSHPLCAGHSLPSAPAPLLFMASITITLTFCPPLTLWVLLVNHNLEWAYQFVLSTYLSFREKTS